jgi:flagellar protein FliS
MTDRDAIAAYRASSMESAPPIKIVRMLYQSAIVRLEQAQRLDLEQDGAAFNDALSKADAIVSELRFALDHQASGDVCTKLESLYLFCEEEIGKAFGDRDVSKLPPVVGVLRTLLSAWEAVEVEVGDVA